MKVYQIVSLVFIGLGIIGILGKKYFKKYPPVTLDQSDKFLFKGLIFILKIFAFLGLIGLVLLATSLHE